MNWAVLAFATGLSAIVAIALGLLHGHCARPAAIRERRSWTAREARLAERPVSVSGALSSPCKWR